jgi:hypothetical protein
MRSSNIAFPIVALLALVAADRVFHPHRRAPPRVVCSAARSQPSVDQVVEKVASECAGPDAVDDCGPPVFADRFVRELPVIHGNRGMFEHRWIERLGAGDRAAAFGLAYLGSLRALPELRLELLNERHFHGWQTSRPNAPDVLYADEQYPRQLALITAIEHISLRSVTSVVRLSPEERGWLRRDAADCDRGAGARWLLYKLEGAPLPSEREIAAGRRACEQQ